MPAFILFFINNKCFFEHVFTRVNCGVLLNRRFPLTNDTDEGYPETFSFSKVNHSFLSNNIVSSKIIFSKKLSKQDI